MSTSRIAPRTPTAAPLRNGMEETEASPRDGYAPRPSAGVSSSAVEEASHAPAAGAEVQAARRRALHSPAGQQLESRVRSAAEGGGGAISSSAPASVGQGTREVSERVREVVQRIVANEGADGPWTSPDGMCLDLAAKWQQRLSAEGLPARIATVDPVRREPGVPVTKGMEGKFHAFAVIEVPGSEPVVIDGSWRQFIQGAEHKPGLEGVFVGTSGDLVKRLAPYRASLQVEIHDDPLLGRRDPRETVELAYGTGPHARLRELLDP
ncbi:MAG: hypothetical protein ACO3JL_09030 [Myxococcota bacterium]